MKHYKKEFIELLVRAGALKFGEFTLKSGRLAPYFLNAGSFYSGEFVTALGKAYASAYLENGLEADVIFGPAYKGIPLSVVTTSVLHSHFKTDVAYCFNRKEAKDHGEKSLLVGAPLTSETRVLLIDDVITAGTAIRETMDLLRENGDPKVVGVLISLDRMEKNNDGISAVQAIEKDFAVKVYSIVNMDEVVEALSGNVLDEEMLKKIEEYRTQYGV